MSTSRSRRKGTLAQWHPIGDDARTLKAIPVARVKAIKHYKAIFRGGRYGAEEYSGAAGSINDVPTALLRELKGRVEVVPPGTEMVGVPLQSWMRTDD